MATTTNFGWETPDDTDLVKDGAAAMRTLGNSIDASFVDLKGGTTGQVLAKASNTDLDYTWVAQDDSNAIQNAIVDAKGDLISATAADTPARLGVGTNGQVLTANSSTSTGLEWTTPSSGSYTSLASGSLGSGGISLTSISGSYRDLVLIISNVASATTAFDLQLTINNLTGAAQYRWAGYHWGSGSSGAVAEKSGANMLLNNQGQIDGTKTEQFTYIQFKDYANTTNWKHWWTRSKYITSGGGRGISEELWSYYYNDTTAISRIDVVPSTGTITGGTYVLYGVK
jgi:hypothetical protein